MLGAKRHQPLVIVGPLGIEAGILAMRDALFPGMDIMRPRFPLKFVEIAPLTPREIGPMIVTAYPALHTRETNPTSVRIEAGQKVVSYTGDSAWTEHMPALAKDADLFIAECYFFQKAVPFHLNYPASIQAGTSSWPRLILSRSSGIVPSGEREGLRPLGAAKAKAFRQSVNRYDLTFEEWWGRLQLT